MKLVGCTSQTLVTKQGVFVLRVEAFQDDRFRLMFIAQDSHGDDVKMLPVMFRKGTKKVNLDADVWPQVGKQFREALS